MSDENIVRVGSVMETLHPRRQKKADLGDEEHTPLRALNQTCHQSHHDEATPNANAALATLTTHTMSNLLADSRMTVAETASTDMLQTTDTTDHEEM